MPSIRSLAIALTALAGSFANAGPCSASAPTTTTSSSASVPTTTTSSSASIPTTTTLPTTSIAATCTPYSPEPTDLHCGGPGTPLGLTVIDTAQSASVNDCALFCHDNPACLTFIYGDGTCSLLGHSASIVKRAPTSTAGPPWFEIGCFDCGGPTSTASSTITLHTSLVP